MIVSFSVSNFLSVKEEQVLSFEATSDNKYEDYFVRDYGKYRILKMGILYGANASGKTNILKAINLLNILVTESRSADRKINYTPFLFDPQYENSNCKMNLKFFINDKDKYIEHIYEIEFNEDEVVYESLKFYPGQGPALLYERKMDKNLERGFYLKFGDYSRLKSEEQNVLESSTLNNNTILSVLNKINPLLPNVKRVRKWFDNYFTKFIEINSTSLEKESDNFFSDSSIKQVVLDQLMKKASSDIVKINISKDKIILSDKVKNNLHKLWSTILLFGEEDDNENREISNFEKRINGVRDLAKINKTISHEITINGDTTEKLLPFILESNGIKRSFHLAAPLIDSLINSKILILDEIESSLHFDLVKFFILVFLANSGDSQMLFTTHNLLLLEWKILRHDVIWFTEKKEDGSTDLYSLSDFNELNRSNVLKRYLSGQFGAKPDIYDYKLDLSELKDESNGKKE